MVLSLPKRHTRLFLLQLFLYNYSLNELKKICENNFSDLVSIYDIKKDFLILELCENCTKNSFLKNIIDYDIDIEKFSVYEPSLTDIFVLKAGDK